MPPESSKPWHQRPKEPAKAYELLCKYLEMGPDRSYRKLADKLKEDDTKEYPKVAQIKRYGRAWDWVERAGVYDSDQLLEEMKERPRIRERVRQKFYARAPEAVKILLDLMRGVMPLGDTDPVYNKHGDVVGERARVPPTVRAAQAQHVLAMVGLVVPARVELTGAEGEELRLQARQALGGLPEPVLRALLSGLMEADNGPDPAVPLADEAAS
jgi:hypothetical protein